jgi:hypothetical protein
VSSTGARDRVPDALRLARSRRFFQLRVAFLVSLLIATILYGVLDHRRRQARRAWHRPLDVALVLLQRGSLDAAALSEFQTRVDALEEVLEREFRRYGGQFRPVHFEQFGPVAERTLPPTPAASPSFLEPLWFSLALRTFAKDNDAAVQLSHSDFDGKIYVRLSQPESERRSLVEGLGEDGGVVAVTRIELSLDSVDFGLFVITHELFHLLGANDRYDDTGQTLIPDGLGDPELDPLYPQSMAEVMARGRVIAPGREEPPGHLDQLRVGHTTAIEIGWLKATRE